MQCNDLYKLWRHNSGTIPPMAVKNQGMLKKNSSFSKCFHYFATTRRFRATRTWCRHFIFLNIASEECDSLSRPSQILKPSALASIVMSANYQTIMQLLLQMHNFYTYNFWACNSSYWTVGLGHISAHLLDNINSVNWLVVSSFIHILFM